MSDEAATATEAEANETTEEPEVPSGPGIFLGALALVIIYAASFGLAFVLPSPHPPAGKDEAAKETEFSAVEPSGEASGAVLEAKDWPRELYDVPVLVVNLTGARGKRYLRIGITIQYAARDPSKAKELLESRLVPLRDRLISRISSETLETVDDPERKERLKLDILAGVRELCFRDAADAAVLRIYFRDFIIQ